jgi:hypothetical protein
MMTRMESKEEEVGSWVMKSIMIEFQGYLVMERNFRGLYAVWCDGFVQAQIIQDPT